MAPPEKVIPLPVETEFEFSDTNAMTCLLCTRQFKNLDQLKRHNKESDLHKVRSHLSRQFPPSHPDTNLFDRETSKTPTYATLRATRLKPRRPRPNSPSTATELRSGVSCTINLISLFLSPAGRRLQANGSTPRVRPRPLHPRRRLSTPVKTRLTSATSCCALWAGRKAQDLEQMAREEWNLCEQHLVKLYRTIVADVRFTDRRPSMHKVLAWAQVKVKRLASLPKGTRAMSSRRRKR